MTIKEKISILKNLLCFGEAVKYNSITKAAELNGIKAANLSKILKDLEEDVGAPLLERSNQGIRPTVLGQKIYLLSKELSQHVIALLDQTGGHTAEAEISFCFPDNFQLNNLEEFQARHPGIILSEKKHPDADVVVSYEEPPADSERIVVKNNIGSSIRQTIWVSCRQDSEAAAVFAEFINAALHL